MDSTFINLKRFVMKNVKLKYRPTELFSRKTLPFSIILIVLLGLASCTEEIWIMESPQTSNAYIALSWTEDEPDYVDAGTGAIPTIFYWNDYYHIHPGFYTLYYDGLYNDGFDFIEYAWEVDYDIYTNGGPYYDDNYFSIDLNPYGPYVGLDFKSSPTNQNFKVLEQNEKKIIILKEEKEYSLKVTYRKVEIRNRQ